MWSLAIGLLGTTFVASAATNNISLTVDDTCEVDDPALTSYTCDGFQCGVGPCSSPVAAPVKPAGFEDDINVAEWCQYPWYDCSNMMYHELDEVAYEERIRIDIADYTSDQQLELQIALSCSNSMTAGGDKANYQLNSILYITTFHGLPGWFSSCDDTRQKNSAGTCCIHHLPSFWTWHRLYMVQFENSLRQWNKNISLPYWGWVNYPDQTELPSLFLSPYFEVDTVQYRNPFYIYQTSDESLQYVAQNNQGSKDQYCNYTQQTPTPGLFYITTPNNYNSLFRQIYYGMFYKSFVAMDLAQEVPHDNVHDLTFGNMANLRISSLTPIFMFHHGAVEKYFLVWQNLMKDAFGIDYTQKKWQKHYLGCFVEYFALDTYLAPFANANDMTNNADPVTRTYSQTTLDSMDYDALRYEYDNWNIGPLEYDTLIQDVCHYFQDTVSPGCQNYEFDTYTSNYNASMFLAFYIPFSHYGMRVSFDIFRYNERLDGPSASLFNDSFYIISSGYDAWDDAGTRFLYKYDITQGMMDMNEHFSNGTYFVNYTVLVQENDYGDANDAMDTHMTYDNSYIDYPVLIYRNDAFHNSEEVYQIYVGANHEYIYGNNNSVMFNEGASLNERKTNVTVEIIDVYEIDSCGNFDTGFESILITVSNDLYEEDSTLNYARAVYECVDTSTAGTKVGTIRKSIGYSYLVQDDDDETYFSYTSENVINYEGEPLHRHYADHLSFQQFDGRIFTGTSLDTLKNEIDDILEEGQLFIPWNTKFIANDSELYSRIHTITGFSFNDQIQLINCGSDSQCESTQAYVVYTLEEYNNCDNSSSATRGKGSYTSFSCADGWKFESDTTYYFIGADGTCHDGLKLGIYFEQTTDCDTSNSTGSVTCSLPDESRAYGIIPSTSTSAAKDLSWNLTVTGQDCSEFEFTLQGPSDSGWFGYAFFGPYTSVGTSAKQMKGMAAIVFECQECEPQEATFVQLWNLIKEGVHNLIADLSGSNIPCTSTISDGIKTVKCTGVSSSIASGFLTSYPVNTGAMATNYMLYAEYTGGCDSSFTSVHSTEGIHSYTLSTNTDEDTNDADITTTDQMQDDDDIAINKLVLVCVTHMVPVLMAVFVTLVYV